MNNQFGVKFANEQTMSVEFHQDGFAVDFGPGTPTGDYDGPYRITPTTETQVLQTRNKLLDGEITIEPIPDNYGLITWNGSVITVS